MRLLKRFGYLFDLELDPKLAVDNVGHTIEIEEVIGNRISRHLLPVLTSDINIGKSLWSDCRFAALLAGIDERRHWRGVPAITSDKLGVRAAA
jgi:hypothetical protein